MSPALACSVVSVKHTLITPCQVSVCRLAQITGNKEIDTKQSNFAMTVFHAAMTTTPSDS